MLGYWPGSAVHQREVLANPRFEDFEYSSFEEDDEDCLAWMGNGMIVASMEGSSTTGYLDTVDIPPPKKNLTGLITPPITEEDCFSVVGSTDCKEVL